MAAFDPASGAVVWKNQAFLLAPASPILIEVDGQDQLVQFTPGEVVGLDPRNGASLWSHPHETNHGLNISPPSGEREICCSTRPPITEGVA